MYEKHYTSILGKRPNIKIYQIMLLGGYFATNQGVMYDN